LDLIRSSGNLRSASGRAGAGCFRRSALAFLAAVVFASAGCGGAVESAFGNSSWSEVEEGLLIGELDSPLNVEKNSSKITVIKIDPKNFSFRLLCSSELGREKHTAAEWCEKYKLVAAANAGMFQEDGVTSVGYMKNFSHINNPRLGRANTVLAFNPVEPGLPEIRIIDRECQDFDGLKKKYHTLVQSIRMISCEQQNVWSQQSSKWSTLAIGIDAGGNVLLLYSRTPQTVHDFIQTLLALPLDIQSAMYLEGGPQASLYLSAGKTTLERNGVWEGRLDESSPFEFALPIPNVIGIVRKTPPRS
jgi:uncharacterized protein YigE (DUF2233 family)